VTVIAYSARHRIMASDSRMTDSGSHLTTCKKIFRAKTGALLGLAGDGDARDIVRLFERRTKMPSRATLAALEGELAMIVARPDGQLFRVCVYYLPAVSAWIGEVIEIADPFVAIGTGAAYAYGAMSAGADPIKAVEIACRWDVLCGLPVQSEKLRPPVSPTTPGTEPKREER